MGVFRSRNKSIHQTLSNLKVMFPAVLINFLIVIPAHAAAGKVFDFNGTLPVMVLQFLLLMVFLEKNWFGPVGRVLDDRDAKIRARLSSVKAGGEELGVIQIESEMLLRDARTKAQTKINEAQGKASAN